MPGGAGGAAPAAPRRSDAGPLRPVAHRVPPRRQRPGGALQLALRPPHRRDLHPAHRGHRHRAQPRGVGGGDPVVAGVAGHGARRGPLPPVGAHRRLPRRRRHAVGRRRAVRVRVHAARRSTPAPRATPPPATTASVGTGVSSARAGRLRFRVPDTGTTVVHDLIRGDVVFAHEAIEDFVVVKSSGAPLFVLANVVDDIDMRITHVIRGEDLLPSTPKGLLAVVRPRGRARGPARVRPPAPARQRAAPEAVQAPRRRGRRVLPERGYLADAMRNYLALLGWSDPEGREILSVQEMVAGFELAEVNHAPGLLRREEARVDEQGVPPGHVGRRVRRGRPTLARARPGAVAARALRRGRVPHHGAAGPGAGRRA